MKKLLEKYKIEINENLDFFKSVFSGNYFDAKQTEVSAVVIEKILTISELKDKVTHTGLIVKNAKIDDKLALSNIKVNFPIVFENTTFNECIDLSFSKIESLSITHDCKVKKGILLTSAKIDGRLDFKGSTFENSNGDAINAENAIVNDHVFLSNLNGYNFASKGRVNLSQISIRGNLTCSGASFVNTKTDKNNEPIALLFDRAIITGSVDLGKGFKAKGEVNFIGAQITGSLYCEGGIFHNPFGRAINAKMIRVEGDVFFDKYNNESFNAQGEVKLSGAQITGQLSCYNAKFSEPKGEKKDEHGNPFAALLAKGLRVNGPLFLNNIEVEGLIDLTDTKINGRFELTDIKNKGGFNLILKSVYACEFKDDEYLWNTASKLNLQDFTYDIISNTELEERKKIKTVIDDRISRGFFPEGNEFSPQPYLQMAKILEGLGHDNAARHLRIRMYDKKRKSNITFTQKVWLYLSKHLINFGYKPFIILRWAFAIWIFGVYLFSLGSKENTELIMPPSKFAWETTNPPYQELYEHYTKFNPWIYSLDVFLPVVNLGQQEYWKPDTNLVYDIPTPMGEIKLSGRFLLAYVYLEILLGWFLTSMLIVGISGLIK